MSRWIAKSFDQAFKRGASRGFANRKDDITSLEIGFCIKKPFIHDQNTQQREKTGSSIAASG